MKRVQVVLPSALVRVLVGVLVGVRTGVLAFLVCIVAPRAALACAVCSAGRDDESNTAFLISTIFLSVLPLAALGTLVFVLWRRIQRHEADASPRADERAVSQVAGA